MTPDVSGALQALERASTARAEALETLRSALLAARSTMTPAAYGELLRSVRDSHVGATELAELLGISRPRLYQILGHGPHSGHGSKSGV